jgi:hypothetical protein
MATVSWPAARIGQPPAAMAKSIATPMTFLDTGLDPFTGIALSQVTTLTAGGSSSNGTLKGLRNGE